MFFLALRSLLKYYDDTICRGHSSFVNSAIYSKDGTQVISASSDGTVRLWDIRTSDCLISFR